MVDVPAHDYERATGFWTAALGRPARHPDRYPEYAELGEVTPGVSFDVQSVGDSSPRIHIDVETDDVEAEVARLIGLGAGETERLHDWVVMRDPVGTAFCVVPVQLTSHFEAHATTWD
jgi:hypothetical protein